MQTILKRIFLEGEISLVSEICFVKKKKLLECSSDGENSESLSSILASCSLPGKSSTFCSQINSHLTNQPIHSFLHSRALDCISFPHRKKLQHPSNQKLICSVYCQFEFFLMMKILFDDPLYRSVSVNLISLGYHLLRR